MHLYTHSGGVQLPVCGQGRSPLLSGLDVNGCVFCLVCVCVCVCLSSPLCLWFCLPCQAEMASCGSEPPSWKSSVKGRVWIWPLCVWGSLSPPTQSGVDWPRAWSREQMLTWERNESKMNLMCSSSVCQSRRLGLLGAGSVGWCCSLWHRHY